MNKNNTSGFLRARGVMQELIREKDWTQTSLGATDTWPQSLRSIVGLILNSGSPMCLYWGPDLICFFNESYSPVFGDKADLHTYFGNPAKNWMGAQWNGFKSIVDDLLSGTCTSRSEEQVISRTHNGKIENIFWTFSYSEVLDDNTTSGGIFVAANSVASIDLKDNIVDQGEEIYIQKVSDLKLSNETADNILKQIYFHEFHASEKKFRDLVMESPVPKALLRGENFVVEIANGAMLNTLWNKKEEHVVGKKIFDIFPELKNQKYASMLQKVYNMGIVHAEKESLISFKRDNIEDTYYVDFEYAPLFESDGHVSGIKITAIDVTEKVRARKNLEASEQRFRNFIKQSPVAMVVLKGLEFYIEIVNDAMLQRWKKKEEDILNKRFLDVFPAIKNERFPTLLEQVYRTGKKYAETETVSVLQDEHGKKTFYVDFEYAPIFEDDGSVSAVIAIVSDVTERVEARLKIAKSEKKFSTLADSMPQHIWTTDTHGHINYYNKSIQEYSGLTQEELIRHGLVHIVHPDDQEENIKQWTKAIETGQNFIFEHRFRKYTGEYRWQLSRAIPQKDAEGKIQMWVGTSTDIQENKNAEEKLDKIVRERTLQLERSNEDLQQFAHVASHDLKEPLRKIKIFTNRVHSEYGSSLPENAIAFLNKIDDASSRMQMMIDGVLAYSTLNANEQTVQEVDLNKIIENVESDLEVMIQQTKAKIKKEKLPVIEGAEILIHQLFYNLIKNSLKFRKNDLPPLIEIVSEIIERNKVKFVKIVLSDEGIGFDNEHAERIFETFVRLNSKDAFEGSGLGLALCKKIVLRHGGTIEAEGIKNKGSVFRILLPLRQTKKVA